MLNITCRPSGFELDQLVKKMIRNAIRFNNEELLCVLFEEHEYCEEFVKFCKENDCDIVAVYQGVLQSMKSHKLDIDGYDDSDDLDVQFNEFDERYEEQIPESEVRGKKYYDIEGTTFDGMPIEDLPDMSWCCTYATRTPEISDIRETTHDIAQMDTSVALDASNVNVTRALAVQLCEAIEAMDTTVVANKRQRSAESEDEAVDVVKRQCLASAFETGMTSDDSNGDDSTCRVVALKTRNDEDDKSSCVDTLECRIDENLSEKGSYSSESRESTDFLKVSTKSTIEEFRWSDKVRVYNRYSNSILLIAKVGKTSEIVQKLTRIGVRKVEVSKVSSRKVIRVDAMRSKISYILGMIERCKSGDGQFERVCEPYDGG